MKKLWFQKRAGFLFLAVVFGMALPVYGQYGGGDGSAANPYQIWDPNHMNAIGANSGHWGKCFKLMANIDMSRFTGTQYKIIGNSSTKFTGKFDGNRHIITNLTYTTTSATNYVGLFGYTNNATIQNLRIENVSISSGGDYIGGLVGYHNSGTLNDCCANGLVSGNMYIGGLAGWNVGTITGCYANSLVSGGEESVGGLVGVNGSMMDSGTITSCYATGSVSGAGYYVGGLVGLNYRTITASYATGLVSGADVSVRGLVGMNLGLTLNSSFWDVQTSGQEGSAGGKGLTTAQMKTKSIYQNAGWAGRGWVINDGVDYPHLSWEGTSGVPIPAAVIPFSGSGTAKVPYLISTPAEFALLSWYAGVLDKQIRLTANLDLGGFHSCPK